MTVFLLGRLAASQMPFFFIDIEDFNRLIIQRFVDSFKILRDILMYRAFADSEVCGNRPNGCFMLDQICGKNDASLLAG